MHNPGNVPEPPTREELLSRLHKKLGTARARRTKSIPAEIPPMPEERTERADAEHPEESETGTDVFIDPAAVAKRQDKRRKRKMRKMRNAYAKSGIDGLMHQMHVKDPEVRKTVREIVSQVTPGSGAPKQQTVDDIIAGLKGTSSSSSSETDHPSDDLIASEPSRPINVATEDSGRVVLDDISTDAGDFQME